MPSRREPRNLRPLDRAVRYLRVLGWLLLVPFYTQWAIGLQRGYPFDGQWPQLGLPLSVVAILFFLVRPRADLAAALMLAIVIPLGSEFILMDHWDDVREYLARGDDASAIRVADGMVTSWGFAAPSRSRKLIYETHARAYCDAGNFDRCRELLQLRLERYEGTDAGVLEWRRALDVTLAEVRGFDEQRRVTAAEIDAWLHHAGLLEGPLQAPTQALRIHHAIATPALPAELQVAAWRRITEVMELARGSAANETHRTVARNGSSCRTHGLKRRPFPTAHFPLTRRPDLAISTISLYKGDGYQWCAVSPRASRTARRIWPSASPAACC